jgi:2-dehydropantoate 2-reductase
MDLIAKQVPEYLLVGSGRVARHFCHYFSLLKIPFEAWSRKDSRDLLSQKLQKASHVILLISDKSIENFITEYLQNTSACLIHFSGSLATHKAYGMHPLMTFNENLYELEEYMTIPFIIDDNSPDFKQVFPLLPNPHFRLDVSLKAKYHALCVLSGNFSCLLWKKLFYEFKENFNFPESIAHPYLLRQVKNLVLNSKTALTGPLVREDVATIEKNLTALDADPAKELYQSFLLFYQHNKGAFT